MIEVCVCVCVCVGARPVCVCACVRVRVCARSGTRAVSLEFNVYNTMTKMVTTARSMIEIYETNYINPWSRFYTYRANLYDAYLDQFRLVAELVYLVMWVYFLQKEGRRVYWHSPM